LLKKITQQPPDSRIDLALLSGTSYARCQSATASYKVYSVQGVQCVKCSVYKDCLSVLLSVCICLSVFCLSAALFLSACLYNRKCISVFRLYNVCIEMFMCSLYTYVQHTRTHIHPHTTRAHTYAHTHTHRQTHAHEEYIDMCTS